MVCFLSSPTGVLVEAAKILFLSSVYSSDMILEIIRSKLTSRMLFSFSLMSNDKIGSSDGHD